MPFFQPKSHRVKEKGEIPLDYSAFFTDCYAALGTDHDPSTWQKREETLLLGLTTDFLPPAPRDSLYRLFCAVSDVATALRRPLPADLLTHLTDFALTLSHRNHRPAIAALQKAEAVLQPLPLSIGAKTALTRLIREGRCLLLQIT